MPGGYRVGNVINIDHHAPTDRMRQHEYAVRLAERVDEILGGENGDA